MYLEVLGIMVLKIYLASFQETTDFILVYVLRVFLREFMTN